MFILERLISIIAPHNCLSCSAEGGVICAWCAPDTAIPLPSRCYICKAITDDFAVCSRCYHKSKLRNVWVSTEYDGLAKRLLQFYKFERGQESAKVIAGFMADTLPVINNNSILVPVPTASSRQRVRGYDHTKLLAKVIAEKTALHSQALIGRLGQTRQVGSSREERLKQLNFAFYAKRPETVRGQSIILVDDIVTSGGTLEAVAKVLKLAGAKSVDAIVFAQKN